jgi:hypothetical protein
MVAGSSPVAGATAGVAQLAERIPAVAEPFLGRPHDPSPGRCPIGEPGWRTQELTAALNADAAADADTAAGADDARLLRLLAVSELAEPGAVADPHFAALVRRVASTGGAWLDGFVRSLAGTPGLSAPAVAVALEAAAAWSGAHRPGGRQLVAAAPRAPADVHGALGYWRARHGAALPKPVKRGLADAVTRLFDAGTVARRSSRHDRERLADLLRAVHPVPATAAQSEAFRTVLGQRPPPGPPGVSQIIGGHAGRPTAAEWAAAIPAMSVAELLRHLPDFDRAGLDGAAAAEAMARLGSPPPGLSPLLVYRRYRQVRTRRWDAALAAALAAAVAGLPRWPGRTLLMVDVLSGDTWRRRPRRRPAGDLPYQPRSGATPGMLAVALGGALRLAGSDVEVVGPAGRTFAPPDPARLLETVEAFGDFRPDSRWGRRRYASYDRVLLVKVATPWNTRDDPQVSAKVPLYRFGYRRERSGYHHERSGHRQQPFRVSGRHVEFWGLTEHAAWLVPLWEDALRAGTTGS